MSGDVSGAQLSGRRGRGVNIFENWKNCPKNLEKCFDCVHS